MSFFLGQKLALVVDSKINGPARYLTDKVTLVLTLKGTVPACPPHSRGLLFLTPLFPHGWCSQRPWVPGQQCLLGPTCKAGDNQGSQGSGLGEPRPKHAVCSQGESWCWEKGGEATWISSTLVKDQADYHKRFSDTCDQAPDPKKGMLGLSRLTWEGNKKPNLSPRPFELWLLYFTSTSLSFSFLLYFLWS